MEVRVKPHSSNIYPNGAIFIKGNTIKHWASEIDRIGFGLHEIKAYPLPGIIANSLYGCLVIPHKWPDKSNISIGTNTLFQIIENKLFIPGFSKLFPKILIEEIEQVFPHNQYVFHPEIGWVELSDPLDWSNLLATQKPLSAQNIIIPSDPVLIPEQIKAFIIKETPPDEVLKKLEENVFPKRKDLNENPLGVSEKIKLFFLRPLFKRSENSNIPSTKDYTANSPSRLSSFLHKIFGNKFSNPDWIEKLNQDYKDLEKRNQKAMDKLMRMFNENPEEALKYAIPLDSIGSGRGKHNGTLDISRKWMDFNLFSGTGRGTGPGAIIGQSHFNTLENQYRTSAQSLVDEGKYEKAAFVYMRLLKNYTLAAQTLEKGKMYKEAASVYLKYDNNKKAAALCYEKGNMYEPAIELYDEMGDFEKAGDLYINLGKEHQAREHYEKAIKKHVDGKNYFQGSTIYLDKMNAFDKAQNLLLEGWRNNAHASRCMIAYFNNIPEVKQLAENIEKMYLNEVDASNRTTFLNVVTSEFRKQENKEVKKVSRDIAYEIISKEIERKPNLASDLKAFNPEDKMVLKDILRYKQSRKKP